MAHQWAQSLPLMAPLGQWWQRLRLRTRWLGSAVVESLYPSQCAWCGANSVAGKHWTICDGCRRTLKPVTQTFCCRCGMPRPRALAVVAAQKDERNSHEKYSESPPKPHPETGCPHCRKTKRQPFSSVAVGGIYRGRLRQAVILAKKSEHAAMARVLGQLTVAALKRSDACWRPDLVTHVPTHWLKRARRGHCSAEVIADTVAGRLHRPHRALLVCTRATEKQGTLGVAARRQNVKDAFRASSRSQIEGKQILIIDDVMTTGSTVAAASRALLAAGAKEVRVAVAARGVGIQN